MPTPYQVQSRTGKRTAIRYVWQSHELEQLRLCKQQGLSTAALAAKFDVSFNHIRWLLATQQLRNRYDWQQMAAEIEDKFARGCSVADLAAELGLARMTVYHALHRNNIRSPRKLQKQAINNCKSI